MRSRAAPYAVSFVLFECFSQALFLDGATSANHLGECDGSLIVVRRKELLGVSLGAGGSAPPVGGRVDRWWQMIVHNVHYMAKAQPTQAQEVKFFQKGIAFFASLCYIKYISQ